MPAKKRVGDGKDSAAKRATPLPTDRTMTEYKTARLDAMGYLGALPPDVLKMIATDYLDSTAVFTLMQLGAPYCNIFTGDAMRTRLAMMLCGPAWPTPSDIVPDGKHGWAPRPDWKVLPYTISIWKRRFGLARLIRAGFSDKDCADILARVRKYLPRGKDAAHIRDSLAGVLGTAFRDGNFDKLDDKTKILLQLHRNDHTAVDSYSNIYSAVDHCMFDVASPMISRMHANWLVIDCLCIGGCLARATLELAVRVVKPSDCALALFAVTATGRIDLADNIMDQYTKHLDPSNVVEALFHYPLRRGPDVNVAMVEYATRVVQRSQSDTDVTQAIIFLLHNTKSAPYDGLLDELDRRAHDPVAICKELAAYGRLDTATRYMARISNGADVRSILAEIPSAGPILRLTLEEILAHPMFVEHINAGRILDKAAPWVCVDTYEQLTAAGARFVTPVATLVAAILNDNAEVVKKILGDASAMTDEMLAVAAGRLLVSGRTCDNAAIRALFQCGRIQAAALLPFALAANPRAPSVFADHWPVADAMNALIDL